MIKFIIVYLIKSIDIQQNDNIAQNIDEAEPTNFNFCIIQPIGFVIKFIGQDLSGVSSITAKQLNAFAQLKSLTSLVKGAHIVAPSPA